jgi:hypothetical protein
MLLIPDYIENNVSGEIVDDYPGEVVYNSLCENFNFNTVSVNEIDVYCREKGYNVDKIIICSYLSSDCGCSDNIKSSTKSRLFVTEKDNKIIAILYIDTNVQRK